MKAAPVRFLVFLFLATAFAGNAMAQAAEEDGDVVIQSDPRLAVLVRKTHSYVSLITPDPPKTPVETVRSTVKDTYTGPTGLIHHDVKTVYTGKGFRVQIYNGPSREKALAIKTEFMRRFPGVHSYIFFVAPGFRVKIGDYRSRSDAEGMLREANSMFSPSMIVPDMVTISTY